MIRFLSIILVCACCSASAADDTLYAVALSAAPVLNTSAFRSVFGGDDGITLRTDRCGQVRELEFIALPGTVFTLRGKIPDGSATVFRVETDDYPLPTGAELYVESRFVLLSKEKPVSRARTLPSSAEIIAALQSSAGLPYVWGGNVQGGVAEMMDIFYNGKVSAARRQKLTLSGLDCSGLLYQATGGWTPRNTSRLVSYGRGVQITGKTADAIALLMEPLDLIVWNGHVLIVLDRDTVIESRLECGKAANGGVVITPLRQRLREIMRTRQPMNEWPAGTKGKGIFVVRRWFVPKL